MEAYEIRKIFIEEGFIEGECLDSFIRYAMLDDPCNDGNSYDEDEIRDIWSNRAMTLFEYNKLGFTAHHVFNIEREDWDICLDGGWEDTLGVIKTLIETGAMVPNKE